MIISKTCNIFIDHITLSGGKSSLSSQSELHGVNPGDGVNYHQVRSVTQQRNTFQFIAAGENISLSESSPVRADGNAMSEKLSTLGPTEGPMLQLKIIGIGTSTSMEHNPYVNALNSDGLDLQNTFQFTNTNNKIIPTLDARNGGGSSYNNLNVHTYTDTTFNYVSTIKATPQHPVQINNIRFNLTYKYAKSTRAFYEEDALVDAFNVRDNDNNRAIIEFLFDPI